MKFELAKHKRPRYQCEAIVCAIEVVGMNPQNRKGEKHYASTAICLEWQKVALTLVQECIAGAALLFLQISQVVG
jgi:hypothetical protein